VRGAFYATDILDGPVLPQRAQYLKFLVVVNAAD
jgi:hypothetical protein